ncbi:MAG TPA: V-type ATP synthase subunit F [Anaerolineae bacterium]|nr:V-type ATP synthase subunit F [Anaerolineae bacterium]HOQ99338.1 V-type ATP synthase subunit F [Anaerolineae bacterium]HPL26775.1 V-type ATP synthase subunit F [Anaerolineae bacterium]
MKKGVFVIGDRDAVLGLALIGVDGLATDDPEVAAERLAALHEDPAAGLVLVTAGLARRLGPRLEALKAAAGLPVIYEIPDGTGRPERAPLADLVRRALGVGT